MRVNRLLLIGIFLIHLSFVKSQVLKPGIPTDTVLCQTNSTFSYALYLPSTYQAQTQWPVIYIFDPAARGKIGMQNFIPAAEKYGYILACSNNSRNGDMNLSVEAGNAMFADVENRFSLDRRRMYMSGFSGGSRLASYIALNSDAVSGVIGCGAGFPSMAFESLPDLHKFNYIGLVGLKDMNFQEMQELEELIRPKGANIAILLFDDGHKMPNADLLKIAMGWMQLQASKNDPSLHNNALGYELFQQWNAAMKEFEQQKECIIVAKYYQYLITYFPQYSDSLHYREKLDSMVTTKPYKKMLEEWNDIKVREIGTASILSSFAMNVINGVSLSDSLLNNWTVQIENIRKLTTNKNKNLQRMAYRILNSVESTGNLMVTEALTNKEYSKAIVGLRLFSQVNPKNYYIHFTMAIAYAGNNQFKKSMKALEKSIKLGFDSKKTIENERLFLPLHNEKRFIDLLAKLH